MARIKNIMEKAEAMTGKVDPMYDVSGIQLMEIYTNSRDCYHALSNAFKIGYLQGKKAAEAEIRRRGTVNG